MKKFGLALSYTFLTFLVSVTGLNAQERVWAGDRTIEQISEHVFRWGSDGQFGAYILTNEGIILVDGHYCQSGTVEWLKDQLDRRYDVPVRYVVLSHDHQDHNCNTDLFADTAVGVGHRNIIPHLTFERRKSIVPAITFEDEMELQLGGVLVRLLYFGPTHSDNLIQVHIPQEEVLIAIDSAKGRNLFPDFRDMEVNNQIRVMGTLAGLADVSVVLPGHGPVVTQDAFLDHRRYIRTLKDTVLQHMADGRTLQEIKTLTEASMLEEFGDYNRIDAYLVPNIVTMWDFLYRYRESNSRITDIEAMECIEDSRQCRTSD